MDLDQSILQKLQSLPQNERAGLELLLERTVKGQPPQDLQIVTHLFGWLNRECIFESQYGSAEHLGQSISKETIDSANEAWKIDQDSTYLKKLDI